MKPESGGIELTRHTLAILFIFSLIAASFWILRPFLSAAIWATMVVIATWPVLLKLEAMLGGKRGRAAAVMIIGFLLVLIIPVGTGMVVLLDNASLATGWLHSLDKGGLPQAPTWVASVPLAGPKAAETWNRLVAGGPDSVMATIGPYAGKVFQWLIAQLGGGAMLMVQFALAVIIAGVLYMNGEQAAHGVILFGRRLAGDQGERTMILAARSVRSIALGVIVTALAQTALAGLGMALAGVPGYGILTVLVFVLCIAQLGPVLIVLPSAGWLIWSGETGWGIALLIWGVAVGMLDNFLRPALIKKGVDLPFLLILSGVMGGMMAFGVVGIFAGPVVLAVTYTLLSDWVKGEQRPEAQ